MRSKLKYLNFAISRYVFNIYLGISHAEKGIINTGHMKRGDIGGGVKGPNSTFQNTVILHIK